MSPAREAGHGAPITDQVVEAFVRCKYKAAFMLSGEAGQLYNRAYP
jgi:hypothetical protein